MTLFGSTVTMEIKDQDVSQRGMVTSGRDRPSFALLHKRVMSYGNLEGAVEREHEGRTGRK